MFTHGLTSFQDLSVAHAVTYRNHVRNRPAENNAAGDGLSPGQQRGLLRCITRLASMQRQMEGAGTKFSLRERRGLVEYLFTKDGIRESTLTIPDDVFRRLMFGAIGWLRSEGHVVLQLRDVVAKYRALRAAGSISKKRSRATYERILATTVSPDATLLLDGSRRPLASLTYSEIARAASIMRGACFVVIGGGVGMRESEILSLRVGCRQKHTLPNGACIVSLRGTLYKTSRQRRGELAEWVAGYDEADNPVLEALEFLEKMNRGMNSTGLFASFYRQRRDPRRLEQRHRIKSDTLKEASLMPLLDQLGIRGWNLKSHQLRKTFARHVALSSVSAPFILMRHYKHQSVLMTERYLPNDPELVAEIFEATEGIVAERLEAIFGASELGGLGGKRILANNAAYRGEAKASARRKLVELTMRDPTSHFRPTIYGMCIFEAAVAKCRSKVENVGVDTCAPCSNFAVDLSHFEFWSEEETTLMGIIADQAALGIVNLELHRKLEQARKIIAELRMLK